MQVSLCGQQKCCCVRKCANHWGLGGGALDCRMGVKGTRILYGHKEDIHTYLLTIKRVELGGGMWLVPRLYVVVKKGPQPREVGWRLELTPALSFPVQHKPDNK